MSQVYESLCQRIRKFDRKIRYVGILDRDGRVLAGGMRRGIRSLEPETEDLRLMVHIISETSMWDAWDRYFGKTLFTIIKRELVNLMVFPYSSKLLLVSTEPDLPVQTAYQIRDIISEFDLSIT